MADPVGTTQPIGGTLDGPPTPPAGYQLQPKPPAGYTIQQTTNAGEPYWVSDAVGRPVAVQSAPDRSMADPRLVELAFVDAANHPTSNVQVVTPNLYTPSVAAHETTHNFQFSRNSDFQQNLDALDNAPHPAGPTGKYDYGGVEGLAKNHTELGKLNREQQARIVEDLTTAQSKLHPHMSQAELAQWDKTKTTLERPIQELQRVPAAQHNPAASTDSWLAQHTIFNGHPLQRALDFISKPTIDTRPLPAPSAPSTALGYANPSEYVR